MNKQQLHDITYSQDTLIPGIYIWFDGLVLKVGGTNAPSYYYFIPCSSRGLTIVVSPSIVFTTDNQPYRYEP
jgi:hypothetical protein